MKNLLALILAAAATVSPALADNGLVTIPSRNAVAETMDRFEAIVRQEKFQVFARVDFQPLALANGGKVRPSQVLIFGRGGILPPLLPIAPTVAIDLPLKALAWEDGEGKVWLTYNTGEYLKQRHGIAGNEELLKRLSGVMASLAGRAVE